MDPIADADSRYDWVLRATADRESFQVDRIEVDRPGPSYLVDTLESLRKREEGTKLVFIVGEDAFSEMGDWRAPERLFTLTDFAVMTRPPGQIHDLEQCIPDVVRDAFEFTEEGRAAIHREARTRIQIVPITALDISSREIRRALRDGRSIRYVVPESIRERIEQSGIYGPKPKRSERV